MNNYIFVEFLVNDSNVVNGDLWLYDKDYNSIADTKIGFLNEYSIEIANYLNDGNFFNKDNKLNIIKINSDDLIFSNNKKFEDITNCLIMLNYGLKNNDLSGEKKYIFRSLSARSFFK